MRWPGGGGVGFAEIDVHDGRLLRTDIMIGDVLIDVQAVFMQIPLRHDGRGQSGRGWITYRFAFQIADLSNRTVFSDQNDAAEIRIVRHLSEHAVAML